MLYNVIISWYNFVEGCDTVDWKADQNAPGGQGISQADLAAS